MKIEVNAKIILAVQGLEGEPLDPELKDLDIVLAAEQNLNSLGLFNILDGSGDQVLLAQYGIRVHMNEITKVTK